MGCLATEVLAFLLFIYKVIHALKKKANYYCNCVINLTVINSFCYVWLKSNVDTMLAKRMFDS